MAKKALEPKKVVIFIVEGNSDKKALEKIFQRIYKNKDIVLGKEELFIDFLEDEAANGVPDSLPASWRYIREELHSLERHTNLHIYFKLNPYIV